MKENFPSEKAILLLSIDKGNFYGREISLNKSSPFFVVIIIIVAPFCLLPSKSMRSVIGVLIGRPLLLLLQQPMSMLSSTASTTYLYLDYPSIKIKCSGRKTLFKVALTLSNLIWISTLSGVINSAAAVGVGALTSATKSINVLSLS